MPKDLDDLCRLATQAAAPEHYEEARKFWADYYAFQNRSRTAPAEKRVWGPVLEPRGTKTRTA